MKARESGMPEEGAWERFFQPQAAVDRLLAPVGGSPAHVVEFGCGYGTFTLPAARRAGGIVTALDIEADAVARVQARAREQGLGNVRVERRDFVAQGSGLEDGTQAHAMVYNLLHLEHPLDLLREAARVLAPRGRISVIHWRSDILTPRGPSLAIRPTPEQCAAWLVEAGFQAVQAVELEDICPYHFGLVAVR
ncbi:MAG: class I SAM-dependent methyltransferase [Holophaga sp.]|jgi:SAM-dependent methyltransferase